MNEIENINYICENLSDKASSLRRKMKMSENKCLALIEKLKFDSFLCEFFSSHFCNNIDTITLMQFNEEQSGMHERYAELLEAQVELLAEVSDYLRERKIYESELKNLGERKGA